VTKDGTKNLFDVKTKNKTKKKTTNNKQKTKQKTKKKKEKTNGPMRESVGINREKL